MTSHVRGASDAAGAADAASATVTRAHRTLLAHADQLARAQPPAPQNHQAAVLLAPPLAGKGCTDVERVASNAAV